MEKHSHNRIKVVFFSTVVFLVTLSIFSFIRIKKLIDSSQWVNHTHVVKLNLSNAFTFLLEMEANQRGFLITKDSTFIRSFDYNKRMLNVYLDKTDSLTIDNISQQFNLKTLKKLVNVRTDSMQSLLNDTITKKIITQKIVGGKVLMNDVRNQINKMESEEDFLLNGRTLLLDKEAYLTPIITICLILSSIIILLVAYYKILKDLKISNTLKLEIKKTNTELELKNEALEKSEQQFLKMLDNNPVALSFGEIGTNKIVYANKLFYDYFGYTEKEVIGHTSDELNLVSVEENARLLPIILGYLEESRSAEELRALPIEETEKLLIKLREKIFKNGFEVLYTRKNKKTFYALVFYEVIE
jgi:PAS domain S-box-containing protein